MAIAKKQLGALEDLVFSAEAPLTFTQTRSGVELTLTKICAETIPYEGTPGSTDFKSIKDTLDSISNNSYTKEEIQTILPKIGFDITNVTPPSTGQMAWNQDEKTIDVGINGVVLQLGQELMTMVRNSTGTTITQGTACMGVGTIGASGRILVAPANMSIVSNAFRVLGIATEDISPGTDGFVTYFGKVRTLDTSTWNEGDVLYLSNATPGLLTNVEPTTGVKQTIARVINKHATAGTLMVRTLPLDENAYNAKSILTKIKTVDGSGSGLDADLLDGKNAADSGVNTIVQRNASGNALELGVATGTSFNSITGLASVAPIMDGTATVGTSPLVARQDHIHPSDTSKISTADVMMAIGNISSPLLDMPLKNSLAMKTGVGSATFTRASTATYVDRYGVLKNTAIDEPRFEKEGYLNEGVSTNLLTYSEDFGNAGWLKSGVSVTGNTVETLDPYGTNLAEIITENALSSFHLSYMDNITEDASGTYTYSVFVKGKTRTRFGLAIRDASSSANQARATFNLTGSQIESVSSTGTYTNASATINLLTNGWYRVSITTTIGVNTLIRCSNYLLDNTATASSPSYVGNGTSGLYIFGAQLEALPFATSYIPTVGSTVTRSGDVLNVTRAGNMPDVKNNSSGFSVVVDTNSIGQNPSTTRYVFGLYVTGTDFIGVSESGNSDYRQSLFNSSGSSVNQSSQSNFKNRRIATTSSNSSLILYLDGVQVDVDTNTTGRLTDTANSLSTFRIGGLGIVPSNSNYFGHISNFRIYDKALTAQEVALA